MVVKLITCKDEFEAEVIKGALADVGIESILQGKHMSQIYGGIGAMSVNVLVDEKDYEKAKEVVDIGEEPEDPERFTLVENKEAGNKEDTNFGCLSSCIAFFLFESVYSRIIKKYFNPDGWIEFIAEVVTICICIGIVGLCGKLIRKYKHKKKQ